MRFRLFIILLAFTLISACTHPCIAAAKKAAPKKPAKPAQAKQQQKPAQPQPAKAKTSEVKADDVAPLALESALPWDTIYTGDVLRVRIRLVSPRAKQEMFRSALTTEQGGTHTSSFTPPVIPKEWTSKLDIRLYTIDTDGNRKQVLESVGWLSYMLSSSDEIDLGLEFGPLVREIIIPADVAQLVEGKYALEVIWNGKDMVDAANLDSSGVLKADELSFEVADPYNDEERAAVLMHSAYAAYMRKDYAKARDFGNQSLKFRVADMDPDRIYAYMITANASIGLKDYASAIDTYKQLLATIPDKDCHLAKIVKHRIEVLEKKEENK